MNILKILRNCIATSQNNCRCVMVTHYYIDDLSNVVNCFHIISNVVLGCGYVIYLS